MNMIKIGGQFVIPTNEVLRRLANCDKPVETTLNNIVGSPVFEEEQAETPVVTVDKTSQDKYFDKFGMVVPVNKKNNIEWIEKKLAE